MMLLPLVKIDFSDRIGRFRGRFLLATILFIIHPSLKIYYLNKFSKVTLLMVENGQLKEETKRYGNQQVRYIRKTTPTVSRKLFVRQANGRIQDPDFS